MSETVDLADPLGWLSAILWPNGTAEIRLAPETQNSEPSQQWWASPNIENPNILIPATNIRAARTAVRRYHDGFSPSRRARSVAAELTMSSPRVAQRLLSKRKLEVVGAGDGVLDGIAELFGVDQLNVAISLATPKSNRKPVLQLIDGTGTCLGWAKIAWNPITENLVATEANWLKKRPLPPLVTPELLFDTNIFGQRVVITSHVNGARTPQRMPTQMPDVAIVRSIAAMGTLDTLAVSETQWWATVSQVLDQANRTERAVVDETMQELADRVLNVGAWHGDFAPWNLMTVGPQVQLIDWEFAADQAPVGFDICHFHTQVGEGIKGFDAAAALNYSVVASRKALAELTMSNDDIEAVQQLYWVELFRRTLALRAQNFPTTSVFQGVAALELLAKRREIVHGQAGRVGA